MSAWSFAENSGESGPRETLVSSCLQGGLLICRVVSTPTRSFLVGEQMSGGEIDEN
jgi:hypothetical protein